MPSGQQPCDPEPQPAPLVMGQAVAEAPEPSVAPVDEGLATEPRPLTRPGQSCPQVGPRVQLDAGQAGPTVAEPPQARLLARQRALVRPQQDQRAHWEPTPLEPLLVEPGQQAPVALALNRSPALGEPPVKRPSRGCQRSRPPWCGWPPCRRLRSGSRRGPPRPAPGSQRPPCPWRSRRAARRVPHARPRASSTW